MALRCSICQEPISASRIEAFLTSSNGLTMPDTCEEHSTEMKNAVFEVYGHKTAGSLVTVNVNEPMGKERHRQAISAFRRAR